MGRRSSSNLTVHRLAVLRETLGEMSVRTGMRMDVFSRAEHGRLPEVWRWEAVASAYRLTAIELVRKVLPEIASDTKRRVAEAFIAEEERRLQTPAPASQSA